MGASGISSWPAAAAVSPIFIRAMTHELMSMYRGKILGKSKILIH